MLLPLELNAAQLSLPQTMFIYVLNHEPTLRKVLNAMQILKNYIAHNPTCLQE